MAVGDDMASTAMVDVDGGLVAVEYSVMASLPGE